MSKVDIARDLSLTDFLERELGMPSKRLGRHARFNFCPNCQDEGHQPNKLMVQIDDKHYFCHRCKDQGSVFDAAMKLWSVSFKEAATKLGANFTSVVKRKPIDTAKLKAEDALRNQKIAEVIQKLKPIFETSKMDFKCIQYLTKERKLPIELVKEAQSRGMLGFLPSSIKKAEKLIIGTVGETLLREAGMWKEGAKRPIICYRPIVFILPGESSAEFRMIGEPEQDMPKSIRFGTDIKYPFVWRSKTGNNKAMIVEGFIDMLSTVALGYRGHVIGIPGCNNWRFEWFPKLKANLNVSEFVLCLDNDSSSELNPGQAGQEKLKASLVEANLTFSEKKLPENSDMNEVLKAKAVA